MNVENENAENSKKAIGRGKKKKLLIRVIGVFEREERGNSFKEKLIQAPQSETFKAKRTASEHPEEKCRVTFKGMTTGLQQQSLRKPEMLGVVFKVPKNSVKTHLESGAK